MYWYTLLWKNERTDNWTHWATAARDNSAEWALYAGGGNAAVSSVQLARWAHTCFVNYSAIVTLPFTTRCSGRGTHHVVCATQQRELFMLVKETLRYNLPFCTTHILTFVPLWPLLSLLCVRVGDSSCGLYNSREGALYIGEGNAARWHCILDNLCWAHTSFVMYCAIVTFSLRHCKLSIHHFAFG